MRSCVSVQVNELSPEAQKVIHSYTDNQPGQVGKYASLCAASGILPWRPPTAQDHGTLLKACCCVQCPLCSVLCAVMLCAVSWQWTLSLIVQKHSVDASQVLLVLRGSA